MAPQSARRQRGGELGYVPTDGSLRAESNAAQRNAKSNTARNNGLPPLKVESNAAKDSRIRAEIGSIILRSYAQDVTAEEALGIAVSAFQTIIKITGMTNFILRYGEIPFPLKLDKPDLIESTIKKCVMDMVNNTRGDRLARSYTFDSIFKKIVSTALSPFNTPGNDSIDGIALDCLDMWHLDVEEQIRDKARAAHELYQETRNNATYQGNRNTATLGGRKSRGKSTTQSKSAKWLPTNRTVTHKGKSRKVWRSAKDASVHAVKCAVKTTDGTRKYRYEKV